MTSIMANKENHRLSLPGYIEEARRLSTLYKATVTVTPCDDTNTFAHMTIRKDGEKVRQEFNITFLCQPETFRVNLDIAERKLENFVERCGK